MTRRARPEKRRTLVRALSASPFGEILARLVRALPGCLAAAFVDQEGEAVDVAGIGDSFDIKVAAAHWRIVLHLTSGTHFGNTQRIQIGAKRSSYLVVALAEGYALVLLCNARGAFHVSERALATCAHELAKEAGFEVALSPVLWRAVQVRPLGPRRLRPEFIYMGKKWIRLEIFGAIVGLRPRERGYRVRSATGVEMTLVREPLGSWWTDEVLR